MHVEGFAPEVAWVTIGGGEDLEERLCIRPTSVSWTVWPSCHKNSLERKNGLVSFSHLSTLHHWFPSIVVQD